MNNFSYYNPVKIVFGKGMIAELTNLVPREATVLVTYGGGSIKRNGVYDQVVKALAGHRVIEFGGIEPNPRYETCMRAVDIARREEVGFLLAVGGGSVLDGTKFIAAATTFAAGDPWQILQNHGATVEKAVPLGCVLTLPATGSEMNTFAVISRESTQEKLAFASVHVYPRFSILDPETAYSLPERQVANGLVDAFAHVGEQYMAAGPRAALQERLAEAVFCTLIEVGPKLRRHPPDYDARADMMWTATQALNGQLGLGVWQDWSTHMIGHELTALYGIDHAQSLAAVMPAVWRYKLPSKLPKLAQFARRVWGLQGDDDRALAEEAIERTREFFEQSGVRTKLSDYGIDAAQAADAIARRFTSRGAKFGEQADITAADVPAILALCR